jgi:hypothetical protein
VTFRCVEDIRAALFERSEFAARPEHTLMSLNRNGVWHGTTQAAHRLSCTIALVPDDHLNRYLPVHLIPLTEPFNLPLGQARA